MNAQKHFGCTRTAIFSERIIVCSQQRGGFFAESVKNSTFRSKEILSDADWRGKF
jgi:hypothetical protein